jgi:glycine hydroxymethyltransferase
MRLGVAAATTRGMKEAEFLTLGNVIADLIDAEKAGRSDAALAGARAKVAELTGAFPIYRH